MVHSIFKRASYISTAILVARSTSAIAGIIIARAVGPSSFGLYAAVWALIEMSIAFTEIGLTNGLKREGSRHPKIIPSLLGNALLVKFMIGVCTFIVAYFSLPVISKDVNAPFLFLPLALAGFAVLCSELLFTALHVKEKQGLVALIMTFRGFIFLVGVGLFAFIGSDIVTIAWFHGILYSLTALTTLYVVIRIVSVDWKPQRILTEIKKSAVFGFSVHLASMWNTIPILFVSHFLDIKEVGYFAVALRFTAIMMVPGLAAKADVFLPALFGLYSTNRGQFRLVCKRMQKLFSSLGILAASTLFVFSDIAILILQGEEYRPAIRILRIMCWYVALSYGALTVDASLTAGDKMWQKVAIQLVVTLVTLGAGPYLIITYGIIGASYLMVFIWINVAILFLAYAYKKDLITFTGISEIAVPVLLTVLLSVLSFCLFEGNSLLRPILFLSGCLVIWGPTVAHKLRASPLPLEID